MEAKQYDAIVSELVLPGSTCCINFGNGAFRPSYRGCGWSRRSLVLEPLSRREM